jgi:hypothetical protein
MTDTKKTLAETLTGVASLPPELRRAPRHRQEKKVKDSAIGWVFVLLGLLGLCLTGYLAYVTHAAPNLWLLGGCAVVSFSVSVFGGLIADRETFMPVASAFVSLVLRVRKKGE